jgi:hypothetical protein
MNLVIKFDFNNMLKIAKFCLTLNTVDPAVKPREDEKSCRKMKRREDEKSCRKMKRREDGKSCR